MFLSLSSSGRLGAVDPFMLSSIGFELVAYVQFFFIFYTTKKWFIA